MNLTFKHGLFLSILIGFLIFLFFFNISVLDPTNLQWILKDSGDLLQHQLGSFAFRNDTWHFPITKTTNINYPEGISIVYTDSNLFLSILAKIFKSIFPPEYQFWGFWYLMCWLLQGLFGYLVVYHLSKDVKYSLLVAILFCLLPTIYHRIEHSNLLPHWLILASILIFIKDDYSEKVKTILFWMLLFFTAMIHAYLLFMLLSIFAVWIIRKYVIDFKSKKLDIANLLLNIGCGIGFILFTWILGYFYNQPENDGLLGFGHYSMNINGIFNPMNQNFSVLFNSLPFRNGQKSEGYQFLGAGLLLLFLIFNVHYFIKQEYYKNRKFAYFFIGYLSISLVLISSFGNFIQEEKLSILDVVLLFLWITQLVLLIDFSRKKLSKRISYLLIPALVCLLISLSNEITIGETRLLKIEIAHELNGIFRLVRSSGRFYWVTNLIFMTFIFAYFHKNFERKQSFKYGLLIFIISLQLFDMQNIKISSGLDKEHKLSYNPSLNKALENTEHVQFMNFFDMSIARQILLKNVTINDFYMAHDRGILSNQRYDKQMNEFKNGRFSKTDLHLFKKFEELPSSNYKYKVYPLENDLLAISRKNINNLKRVEFYHKNTSLKELINKITTKELVIIAVKDEATNNMSKKFTTAFDSTFNSNLGKLTYRQSYLAVFKNGKLIKEKIGTKGAVEYQSILNDNNIYIKSAGHEQGNIANITINGFNYSVNKRGLNCVSIEKTNSIVHTFSFDTFEKNYPF